MTGRTAERELPEQAAGLGPGLSFQYRGNRMAEDWPLRSYLKLGALPGAVPCARLHARHVIWEWGYGELSETAELLASELMTNAVRASQVLRRDAPVRLWLLCDKTRILILVWDGSPQTPVRRNVSEDAEGGRGLVLVEALSAQWDWYAHDQLGGKVVWCEIAANYTQNSLNGLSGWPE